MNTLRLLEGILPPECILQDEPMKNHTSFKTGGNADFLLLPRTEEDLSAILHALQESGIPFFVMGRGSNLLVSDKGFRGVLIKIAFGGARITGNTIHADAGVALNSVAMAAAGAGLAGLEFAAGIPGSLGGGVAMNAGAYGGELKDFIRDVRMLAPDGTIQTLTNEEMKFSYRHSMVQEGGSIVLSATLRLENGDPRQSKALIAELAERRRQNQPLEYASAGSTFKRPEGQYAGELIQRSGLKGRKIGKAQVSEKHAGFVINTGGATSADIYRLILDVQRVVQQQTGFLLEPEVHFVGEFT